MKKLAMTAGLAIAMGMSAAAMAHPVNSGYVTDSGDTVWRTGFGGCWHTGFWPKKTQLLKAVTVTRKWLKQLLHQLQLQLLWLLTRSSRYSLTSTAQ